MRKFFLFIVFAGNFFLIVLPVNSAITIKPVKEIVPPENIYKKIIPLKIKDLQKMIGRKLTLKEKISFILFRHHLKHKTDSKPNQGETALIFGIGAVVLLIAGLFIPYVILGALMGGILAVVLGSVARKENPSDKKALAAILLGWISIGLVALILLLIAIILAGWSSWF